MVWPTSDLVELTSTRPSPKTRAMARASTRSFCGRACPMRVDVADVARLAPRGDERIGHGADHPLALRVRRRDVVGVRRDAGAQELAERAPAAPAAVLGVFEHDERGRFADGHAAPPAIEGPARLGVEQLERVEAHEADARDGVHAPCQRQRGRARADEVGAEGDGGRARGAGHHHRLPGARRAPGASRAFPRDSPAGWTGAPRSRARAAWRASRPRTTPRPRACRRPRLRQRAPCPSGRGAARSASASASRAAARARRSARERRREAPRVPTTSAGTSAAMRDRKPAVSMTVSGRMAHSPEARPVQKVLAPAP